MYHYKHIITYVRNWLQVFACFLQTILMSNIAKNLKIIALQSQLSLFQQNIVNGKISKPCATPAFRQLWVLLSKFFDGWKSSLALFKPDTVIGWHRTAFKCFWTLKSRERGRPRISPKTIALIKRIHKENPLLSPEKIHEQLVNLAVTDAPAPNTIAKYIPMARKSPDDKRRQAWKTFLSNHYKGIWAMDFFVVPTLRFRLLYVLLIMSHDRRQIKHFAITANPSSTWVAQQVREATPYGNIPDYLIHDNDSIFTAKPFQEFLANIQIKSKRTGYHAPWQNGICERVVGILRRELLDYIIPINERHLTAVLKEYIERYYHPVRTHQGIGCQTPVLSDKPLESSATDTILVSEPILGGLYHSYRKAA